MPQLWNSELLSLLAHNTILDSIMLEKVPEFLSRIRFVSPMSDNKFSLKGPDENAEMRGIALLEISNRM